MDEGNAGSLDALTSFFDSKDPWRSSRPTLKRALCVSGPFGQEPQDRLSPLVSPLCAARVVFGVHPTLPYEEQ